MRKQILGLTAAAVAATTLGLAGSSSPAQAVGGINGGNISGTGTTIMELDVAASSPGNAVAAWLRPDNGSFRIFASIATNGTWAPPKPVTQGTISFGSDLHVVANGRGDAAVVWTQLINGEERVRGSRHLGGGTWDGSAPLSGPATSIENTDAAIDDAGRVHVAIGAKVDASDRVLATLWPKGKAAVFSPIDTVGFEPSIAVSPAGAAVLAYRGANNGQADIEVTRRTAATGWKAPAAVTWPDPVKGQPQVGISDAGHGTVLFGDVPGDALAAKVSTTGSLGAPSILSPETGNAVALSLRVSPNGRAMASWANFEGGWVIRSAQRSSPTAGFGTNAVLETTTTLQRSAAFVSDRGAQVIVHDDNGSLTFRHRTSQVQGYATHHAGISQNDRFAADMDRQGNVVAVSAIDAGLDKRHAQADFLDVAGPVSAVTGPGPRTLGKTIPVKWTSSDSLAGVLNTDLIARTSAWNKAGFTAPQVVAHDKTTASHVLAGSFGQTYCFEVQGVDKLANLGLRSPLRCTTIPLDDKHLKGKGWTRKAKPDTFNRTLASTTRKGRVLTRTGIKARRIELVAMKLRSGGVVKVTWNGKSLGTFNLKGKKAKKKVIPIATFSKVRSGKLKIKVVSRTGRTVHIDGLIVAK